MTESSSPTPTPENPEEPNVSYGCCLAAARPVAAMLLLFAAPRPDITAGPPTGNDRATTAVTSAPVDCRP